MFQTELVLFLQSLSSEYLTAFFKFFTEIGRSSYFVPLILVIIFGVSFRAGYIMLHLVIWNGIVTELLKNVFALPRPANVDSTVQLFEKGYPNPTHFKDMGAKSFLGGLPQQVVDSLRANPIDSWGFPSGHTSSALTVWGYIFMAFRKTWIRVLSVVMIIFIPLSRMYLGRHFLADVLGGFLIGFIMLAVFYNLFFNKTSFMDYLFEQAGKIRLDLKSLLFLTYSLAIPFLLLLIPHIDPENSARLLGLNIGFFLLWTRGIPKDEGSLLSRIGRVGMAAVFYFIVRGGMGKGIEFLFTQEALLIELFTEFVAVFLVTWGSTEISIKLKFFKR